jgi:3-methylfumaryl-CoA hydratase
MGAMNTNTPSENIDLRQWIGRQETLLDDITTTPVKALDATFDYPAREVAPGTPLPLLWHWLYFLPLYRQSILSVDGHPVKGGFLPPVPLPRRMWAGSQFEFHSPIRVGDKVSRTSTIQDISEKSGRTGKLVFVKVKHDLYCNGAMTPALTEFHDIVYRAAQDASETPPPPTAAPAEATWRRRIVADEAFLFRYSALTFNGHRIHYDRRYVTEVEGYPGLIVHGPLIATLLLDLLRRQQPEARVKSFRFKAIRPTFDLNPFNVQGEPGSDGKSIHLWASDHEGWLTMDATALLE